MLTANETVINAYRQNSNTSLLVNKIVDHSYYSYVFGASPVGAAPTTYSFSTYNLSNWAEKLQDETVIISALGFGATYIRDSTVCISSWVDVCLVGHRLDSLRPRHCRGVIGANTTAGMYVTPST